MNCRTIEKLKSFIKKPMLLRHKILLVCLALFLLTRFFAINFEFLADEVLSKTEGGCSESWLVTDKWKVHHPQRIVMELDGVQTEVTDFWLGLDLTRDAVIADGCGHSVPCYPKTVFYFYWGDEVVRTLAFSQIFQTEAKLFKGKPTDIQNGPCMGAVKLSPWTAKRINAMIEQHEKELLKQTVRDVDAILRVRGAGVYGEVQEVLKGACDYEQIRLINHTFEDHEEYVVLVNQRHNTLYELPQLPEESRMQEFFVLSIDKPAEIERLIAQVESLS